MLETIKNDIEEIEKVNEDFNRYFMNYIMDVQDRGIQVEMRKIILSDSFDSIIKLEKEADSIQQTL